MHFCQIQLCMLLTNDLLPWAASQRHGPDRGRESGSRLLAALARALGERHRGGRGRASPSGPRLFPSGLSRLPLTAPNPASWLSPQREAGEGAEVLERHRWEVTARTCPGERPRSLCLPGRERRLAVPPSLRARPVSRGPARAARRGQGRVLPGHPRCAVLGTLLFIVLNLSYDPRASTVGAYGSTRGTVWQEVH